MILKLLLDILVIFSLHDWINKKMLLRPAQVRVQFGPYYSEPLKAKHLQTKLKRQHIKRSKCQCTLESLNLMYIMHDLTVRFLFILSYWLLIDKRQRQFDLVLIQVQYQKLYNNDNNLFPI